MQPITKWNPFVNNLRNYKLKTVLDKSIDTNEAVADNLNEYLLKQYNRFNHTYNNLQNANGGILDGDTINNYKFIRLSEICPLLDDMKTYYLGNGDFQLRLAVNKAVDIISTPVPDITQAIAADQINSTPFLISDY